MKSTSQFIRVDFLEARPKRSGRVKRSGVWTPRSGLARVRCWCISPEFNRPGGRQKAACSLLRSILARQTSENIGSWLHLFLLPIGTAQSRVRFGLPCPPVFAPRGAHAPPLEARGEPPLALRHGGAWWGGHSGRALSRARAPQKNAVDKRRPVSAPPARLNCWGVARWRALTRLLHGATVPSIRFAPDL